jgi:glycosyltransferase involved in cell wall biosynthesis
MTAAVPEVSVVMGVRDGAASLPATIASVLAQEGVALELIVVDDGSTDATPALLEELAARDGRVRCLRQEAAGLTAALIRGCAAARAPLVARQDAGDLSLPGRLARQKAALDRYPEVVLASCFTACVGPRGEELRFERGAVPADRPFSLLDSTSSGALPGPTAHGSAMFRRAAYERAGGYRAPFALAQDWDLWLRLAELGPCVVVGQTLYRREISPRSLSFRFHALQRALGEAAFAASRERRAGRSDEEVLERARALGEELAAARRRPSRRAEALGHYHVGQLLRDRGDRRSLRYFRAALARDPFLLRAWVRALQASVGAVGRA